MYFCVFDHVEIAISKMLMFRQARDKCSITPTDSKSSVFSQGCINDFEIMTSNHSKERYIKCLKTCSSGHNMLGIEKLTKKIYIFMKFGQKLIELRYGPFCKAIFCIIYKSERDSLLSFFLRCCYTWNTK